MVRSKRCGEEWVKPTGKSLSGNAKDVSCILTVYVPKNERKEAGEVCK